jgi:hypothetical protein
MMASMELISLTLSGLLPFLLLLHPLLLWVPLLQSRVPPATSPAGARAPPASGHARSAAPKSSRAATHWGKK